MYLDYQAHEPREAFGVPRVLIIGMGVGLGTAALLFVWSWGVTSHFQRVEGGQNLNHLPYGAYYEFWGYLLQERIALVLLPLIGICTFVALFSDERTRSRSWLVLPMTLAIFFAFLFGMVLIAETAYP